MAEPEPYSTPRGVENAIKDAARKAAAADPSLAVSQRIQLEYFNRFLSRVFSEAEASEWILKGGTGMLARVPSARATRDIDLYRHGFTLAHALDDLIRLAGTTSGSITPVTLRRSAPTPSPTPRGTKSGLRSSSG
ncbi:MAG: nucleotidyl transferase AbiEii/AbiGii toxin family protein, partial [Propionibacteriaceae bacterium]|nr:nucleotidyl transferase AbiEii/AbiGii toxin family protein [Propionibacteriaceae bacterium]